MKRILIISLLCLLCFGCANTNKNITVNIYENDSNTVDDKTQDDSQNLSNIESELSNQETNLKDSAVNDDENNYSNQNGISSDDQESQSKNWYSENKDELKVISSEILKEDKENITGIINDVKDWYNENKQELTDISNEIYYNDKDAINDLYNKFKK